MQTQELQEIALADLEQVTGAALSWSGFVETAKGGFGLRTAYREAVKTVTAGVGGWKLANQMYGDEKHGASWNEKWRAMKAMKGFLDKGESLPSWAPQW